MSFPNPISLFDVHIYFLQSNEGSVKSALHLREKIKKEFPHLTVYEAVHRPIGPHPTAMFEVKVTNNKEFGEFIPWLVINRGSHSALVHPHTGDDITDHTHYATWIGQPIPLDMTFQNRVPNDLYPPYVDL